MKVFLSWSGTRSRAVAEALFNWLPRVINAVKPFLSSQIDKGTGWSSEIDGALEGTRFGIICLTRENLSSPWILYEAGALSRTTQSYIWTFLLGVSPTDVQFPLAKFQHTVAEKQDVLRLLQTIRRLVEELGEPAPSERHLEDNFNVLWPILDQQLSLAKELEQDGARSARSDRELLEELLETVRQQSRNVPTTLSYRAVAYLANWVERMLRERKLLMDVGADPEWKLSSDPRVIVLHATRSSDGKLVKVSAPVSADWPQGTSWSYASEIAEELARKLQKKIRGQGDGPAEEGAGRDPRTEE